MSPEYWFASFLVSIIAINAIAGGMPDGDPRPDPQGDDDESAPNPHFNEPPSEAQEDNDE